MDITPRQVQLGCTYDTSVYFTHALTVATVANVAPRHVITNTGITCDRQKWALVRIGVRQFEYVYMTI